MNRESRPGSSRSSNICSSSSFLLAKDIRQRLGFYRVSYKFTPYVDLLVMPVQKVVERAVAAARQIVKERILPFFLKILKILNAFQYRLRDHVLLHVFGISAEAVRTHYLRSDIQYVFPELFRHLPVLYFRGGVPPLKPFVVYHLVCKIEVLLVCSPVLPVLAFYFVLRHVPPRFQFITYLVAISSNASSGLNRPVLYANAEQKIPAANIADINAI